MSASTDRPNRRAFLRRAALAAVALPVAGRLLLQPARAQELVPLDTGNPTAAALGYVEDATKVDATKYPQYKAGSTCANCQFYTPAPDIAGRGGCTLFPGFSVADAGWCVSWQPAP